MNLSNLPRIDTIALLFVLIGLSPVAAQVVVEAEQKLAGTLVSVSDSRLSIRDEGGTVHHLMIQASDAPGVVLESGVPLRFPAQVQVTGQYPIDVLERGDVVKLAVTMNRRGDVEGAVAAVQRVGSADLASGAFPKEQPENARQFVQCQVVGTFTRLAKDRLLVQVPRNEFVRNKTLSIPLADGAELRFASNDHRTAAAGAVVDEAIVARLNTGDRVIRTLRIRMTADSTAERKYDDELALKFRHLSDDPVPPRLVRSRHFMIQTDISERQASILLEKLERMVALLSAYFGARPTGIVQAYVVRDLSQWPAGMITEPAGIAKIKERAGICFSRRRGSQAEAVVYSCDDHGVVQHESTHAFCTLTFGSTGPTWLAEGVAEMGQYWKADEVAVNIDPMVLEYLRSAKPKRTLGEIAHPGRTAAGGWQDYAWRWALCHLLANNPNYSDRFKPLAIALMTGRGGASFATAYGDVEQEISFEYDQFLRTLGNGFDARLCAWQWNSRIAPVKGDRAVNAKVLAKAGWQPTGARLEAGEEYTLTASGDWKLSTKGEAVSADGQPDGRGRLVGVLMDQFSLSEPFDLGMQRTFAAPVAGDLYVRCQEAWHSLSDNSGEISLELRIAE